MHDGAVIVPREQCAHRPLQRVHAIRQFTKRYGVQMSDELYRVLNVRLFKFIARGEGFGIERIRLKKKQHVWDESRYFVVCGNGDLCIAVWDEATMQIATFIPRAEPWPRSL